MKITELELRRELAKLDGMRVEAREGMNLFGVMKILYGVYRDEELICVCPTEENAWYELTRKDDIGMPDYPNDLNACFALARKINIGIQIYSYTSVFTAEDTYKAHGYRKGEWPPRFEVDHLNPATALSLAILSAARGERVELEDANG